MKSSSRTPAVIVAVVALVGLAVLIGFSLDQCGSPELTFPEVTPVLPDLTRAGTVSGTVLWDGAPIARRNLQVTDAWCRTANRELPDETLVVEDGRVADVLVWLKSGLEAYTFPVPREPVEIDQRGCRYVPHVTCAQTWQPVAFLNNDPTPHNVHFVAAGGNDGFNLGMPRAGGRVLRQFPYSGLSMKVKCDIHPWMLGILHVIPHPYGVVTGTDGTFRLEDVPPGDYVVQLVHPELGKREIPITVRPDEDVVIPPDALTFGRD